MLWAGGAYAAYDATITEQVVETVAMEAGNQDAVGQFLVAKTIVNRARNGEISLKATCLARKQYSCWNSRAWARAWIRSNYTPAVRKQAIKALQRALDDREDCSMFYHTRAVRPYWAKGNGVTHGAHVFYEEAR